MQITLNGEPTEVADRVTVRSLLRSLELADAAIAIAVNGTFVPRSLHDEHELRSGDAVELVAPMQGG